MIYERIMLMCPICNKIIHFNTSEDFSSICSNCNVEMIVIEKKFVSTEKEERKKKEILNRPTVRCPYCQSINTKKITNTSKVLNTAVWGIFGTKRHKNYHCNNCNSDF